ncbi:MAG: ATPase, T2SS/T4P/T4SS family [Planctomycetota bacterium]|nr:ATPase, T2SS/T4P/T4SS family [Planctomycetota bacterium]
MSKTRTSSLPGVSLPESLHGSRAEELERLWDALLPESEATLDGAVVTMLDSQGLTLLLDGLDKLRHAGTRVCIADASPTLRAAQKALRLADRLPLEQEEQEVGENQGKRLGEILLDLGFLKTKDIDAALEEAATMPGTYLGQVLLQHKKINEDQLSYALALQHGLPFVKPVRDRVLDVTLSNRIPLADLRSHGALPFLQNGRTLAVALQDPSDVYALDLVRECTGLQVVPSVSTPQEIQDGLDRIQRSHAGEAEVSPTTPCTPMEDVGAEERFDRILLAALIEDASDIHLEPDEEGWMLRYRVDGKLREVERMSKPIGHALCARIKVLADCDISEKRLPQDGRIRFQDGSRDVDLRVNTLPTVHGEKSVMRILDRKSFNPSLEDLGLADGNLQRLRDSIHAPHGLVLVTGPTGSGKTTTLYSALSEIVTPEINASTVENPVERTLPGVNQTQVNFKAGLGFDTCLRALLRQDPDVLMIGEIRDAETAEIAVEAALTGHLVLATLHTNDAPSAATRLTQMGVEPFLISATLRAVMAQRLVRRLCDACKHSVTHPDAVLEKYAHLGLTSGPHYGAEGCPACRGTGYSGRCGVFEVMGINGAMQDHISSNPSSSELRKHALEDGMDALLVDALRRVNAGETTLEEALRAGGSE